MANVLTNAGRDILTNRLIGSGTEPRYVGWSTTAGGAVATGVALAAEKALDLATAAGTRATGTSSRQTTGVANDTYRVTSTLTATGAGTVYQAGLFDNSTIGAGNLFLYGDFAGVALAAGDSLALTFNLQFT